MRKLDVSHAMSQARMYIAAGEYTAAHEVLDDIRQELLAQRSVPPGTWDRWTSTYRLLDRASRGAGFSGARGGGCRCRCG